MPFTLRFVVPLALTVITTVFPCHLSAGAPLLCFDTVGSPGRPFKYVIVSNSVSDESDPSMQERELKILLDPDVFSEVTLTELFRLLSKRYPTPDWMTAEVYTSVKQLPTPEEEDLPIGSELPDDPDYWCCYSAVLIRYRGNELYRYTPRPPDRCLKTVILKGIDPYGSK